MARFTSIGMPRKTFVASAKEEAEAAEPEAGPSSAAATEDAPPKKKVHRAGKKIKRKLERADARAAGEVLPEDVPVVLTEEQKEAKRAKKAEKEQRRQERRAEREGRSEGGGGGGWGRNPEIARRAKMAEERSEQRRLQRISEKQQSLTCFACRESGHTARDCPNVLDAHELESSRTAKPKEAGSRGGEVYGGKCYRCNSNTHSLSQCHKPANPDDPTPYATCYVCLGNGHLSSACPKNAKGVYVNGGSCKICGSVAHLVRNCPKIRAEQEEAEEQRRGMKRRAGADEDDEMLDSFSAVQRAEEGGRKKGKKAKHPPNNNGLREPYKGADGEVRVPQPAAAKKAKVVSF